MLRPVKLSGTKLNRNITPLCCFCWVLGKLMSKKDWMMQPRVYCWLNSWLKYFISSSVCTWSIPKGPKGMLQFSISTFLFLLVYDSMLAKLLSNVLMDLFNKVPFFLIYAKMLGKTHCFMHWSIQNFNIPPP